MDKAVRNALFFQISRPHAANIFAGKAFFGVIEALCLDCSFFGEQHFASLHLLRLWHERWGIKLFVCYLHLFLNPDIVHTRRRSRVPCRRDPGVGLWQADALCQWKHTAAVPGGFAFELRRKNDGCSPSHPLPRHLFLCGRLPGPTANDKTQFELPQLWNMVLPSWLKAAEEWYNATLGSDDRRIAKCSSEWLDLCYNAASGSQGDNSRLGWW